MIITTEIKSLVQRIEQTQLTVTAAQEAQNTSDPALIAVLNNDVRQLVLALTHACEADENRLTTLTDEPLSPYPMDKDGYAVSFDPLQDEAGFVAAWQRYGIVVGKAILSPEQCRETATAIKGRFNALSHGQCDFDTPATWPNMPKDANGTPVLSRGFLDIYHDDVLAQIRQNIRAYIHHVLIWRRPDLWTSFDRIGVKLPQHAESKALPLHVDQNPNIHPDFKTVQGVLAISDCPVERGTFFGVAGSRQYFSHYAGMAKNNGEYVELDTAAPIAKVFEANARPIPLRAGDYVSWDSRTTHANTENISNDPRMVVYLAAGPAQEHNQAALAARLDAVQSGEGSNVREALMHASKKPRYNDLAALASVRQPEQLTLLGELLYGKQSYRKITAAPAP